MSDHHDVAPCRRQVGRDLTSSRLDSPRRVGLVVDVGTHLELGAGVSGLGETDPGRGGVGDAVDDEVEAADLEQATAGDGLPLVGGLVGGFAGGFMVGLTGAWGGLLISRPWLALTGRLPWSLMAFLTDAHHRGLLRQVGGVYQFRHARLHDRLVAHASNDTRHLAADPLPPPPIANT